MTRAIALAASLLWIAANAAAAGAPRPGLCATAAGAEVVPPYVGIFSAFPAELAPLVAATEIADTVEVDGQQFYRGRLGGVNVVLGLLGIGLVNAQTSTERMLANFDVAGIVVSGVAGSAHRIGDVVIAEGWLEQDGTKVWHANKALLAIGERVPANLPEPFATCTLPPIRPGATEVCMPFRPELFFEKLGHSGDDFGGEPFPCNPSGNDIFDCDLPVIEAAAKMAPPVEPDVLDMETAAVCRVATEQRVPMIGVRGVSDGAGDPLGDRGFPTQFFDYYRLAAINAAIVTRGIVTQIGSIATDPSQARLCKRLAKRKWRSASRLIRSAS